MLSNQEENDRSENHKGQMNAFFEVLEEAVEVWEFLAAASKVGTLRGGGD